MKRRTAVNLCMSGASLCVIALVVLLSGCSSFSSVKPKQERTSMQIVVVENPNLPGRVLGTATQVGNTCVITLREYPICLGHEMMHCLSGPWHGTTPNDEYCH